MAEKLIPLLLAFSLLLTGLPASAEPDPDPAETEAPETGPGETEPTEPTEPTDPGEPEDPTPPREKADPVVLGGVDRDLLAGTSAGNNERLLDGFNLPVTEWKAEKSGVTLVTSESFPGLPGEPFEGSRCLVVTGTDGMTVGRVFGTGEEEEKTDLTDCRWLALSCAADADGKEFRLRLTLTGVTEEGETVTQTDEAPFPGGRWETVLVDVSCFDGRGDVRRISVTLLAGEREGETTLALDALTVSTAETLPAALRFLSADYRAQNCTVTYGDGMTVSMNGQDPYIEADGLGHVGFPGDSGIRIRFVNYTGCRRITLYYTTPDGPEFTACQSVSAEITSSASSQSVTLPIRTDTVNAVRIVFEGNLSGDAQIFSVEPVSCPVPALPDVGRLSSCLIAPTRDRVTVSGTLDEADAEKYRGGTLRLYALPLFADPAEIGSGDVPVAETPIAASFQLQAVLKTGDYSCLTKKYAVKLLYRGVLMQVGTPLSVTNPEILSDAAVTTPGIGEKKGISGGLSFDDTDGVRHASVRVRFERLMTLGESAVTHTVDGNEYRFSEAYVRELDGILADYAARGVSVTLVLTVSRSEDAALNRILLHPDCAADAACSAFNTSSEIGLRYLRAGTDFLFDRYGTGKADTSVIGCTVGSSVDRAWTNYGMGAVSLSEFAAAYADAVRTVYNTAKARSSAATVCLSLGCDWNRGITIHTTKAFDARSVLDTVNAALTEGGNIDWRLAFDPYPLASDYLAYGDESAVGDETAPTVTLKNIEVLLSYLTRRPFYYGEGYRSVILLESDEIRLPQPVDYDLYLKKSADYAYGYYKITTKNCSLIHALIVSHAVDYGDTLRWVDVKGAEKHLSYALDVIGIRDWKEVIPAFERPVAERRTFTESVITHTEPSTAVGSYSFMTFPAENGTGGWRDDGGCRELTGGVSYRGRTDLMSVVSDGGSFGIRLTGERPYDFSVSPYLCFELCMTGVAEEGAPVPVTVVVRSPDGCAEAKGELTAGGWTELVVDLNGFSGIRSCESITLRAEGPEGETALLIGGIRLLSDDLSGSDLEDAYREGGGGDAEGEKLPLGEILRRAIPAGVIVICLALLILRVILRKKRENGLPA